MNKHLECVFKLILPELEKMRIDYWVYGGIGVAAYAGKFIRENCDVDIFVKETDFQKAKSILDDLCKQNNYKLKPWESDKNSRLKLDIKIDKIERLSVVPVYLKSNIVKFLFGRGSEEYPSQILEKVERNLSGYRFFTPPDMFIKKLFINYLTSTGDKKNKPKIKDYDAKAILTEEEFAEIYNK